MTSTKVYNMGISKYNLYSGTLSTTRALLASKGYSYCYVGSDEDKLQFSKVVCDNGNRVSCLFEIRIISKKNDPHLYMQIHSRRFNLAKHFDKYQDAIVNEVRYISSLVH